MAKLLPTMRGAHGMPFVHGIVCYIAQPLPHAHTHPRVMGTLRRVPAIGLAAAALFLVLAPAAVQASACVDAQLHEPDGVDWMIHCGLPEQECSVQPERSCVKTGDGDCCALEHVAAHIAHDRDVRAQRVQDIILVVYDSDSVLDASVRHNFNQYGRVAHIASPFSGFGAKWLVAACLCVSVCAPFCTLLDLASAGCVVVWRS